MRPIDSFFTDERLFVYVFLGDFRKDIQGVLVVGVKTLVNRAVFPI